MRVPEIFGKFFGCSENIFCTPPCACIYYIYIYILWEPGVRVPEIFGARNIFGCSKNIFCTPPLRVYILYIYIYYGSPGCGYQKFLGPPKIFFAPPPARMHAYAHAWARACRYARGNLATWNY